jgi:DNA polymerase-3 subunit beta
LEVTVPATVEAAGAAVVPARPVIDLVRRLEHDQLTVDTSSGEMTQLEWTGAEATIPLFNADEFPRPAFSSEAQMQVPGDELRRGVEQVAYAAARDAARGSALEGIELRFTEGEMEVLATDQIRLAWSRRPATTGQVGRSGIIPVAALQALVRLAPQEPEYRFGWDEHGVTFFWPDSRLHSRLLTGSLPDVRRLVPDHYPHQAVCARERLIAACARVSSLAGAQGVQVSLTWGSDTVKVSAEDVGHRAEERLPCRLVGDEIAIAFNARLLVEALEHLDGDEVVVEMTAPDRAARLRPVEGRDHFALVSPLVPQGR